MKTGFLALVGLLAAVTCAETVTVRPVDDGRALCNPDMGWAMHYYDNGAKYGTTIEPGDSLRWYPGCNVVYLRLPWSWLEPEEGKFNWNAIDTPAQRWLARGGQVAFRITVSETSKDPTPAWVAKAGAKVIRWTWGKGPDPNGKCWECVPDDPVFLEKYGNFLKALAARYDGRKDVAFVDIGSVGIWGEGHTGRTIRLSNEETQRIVKLHIDLHRRHFKKTLLVANDDFCCTHEAKDSEAIRYALAKGLGWRDDSIMVDGERNGYRNWYHESQALRFAKTTPIVLEIGHYGILKERGNWNGETLLKAIEAHQASFLSIHGDPRLLLDENADAVRRSNLRLGYRFQAREISYPSVATVCEDPAQAVPFKVRFVFANAGAAPCYRDAHPCLTLKNAKGGIIAVLADGDFNLKTLPVAAPGQAHPQAHEAEFVLGRWRAPVTPPGEHDVYLSVGKADGTPVYELPMAEDDGMRRYRVGKMRVEVR